MAAASTNDPAKRVRFPTDLLDKIKKASSESGRSENSEIVYRLRESFRDAIGTTHGTTGHEG